MNLRRAAGSSFHWRSHGFFTYFMKHKGISSTSQYFKETYLRNVFQVKKQDLEGGVNEQVCPNSYI